MSERDMAVAREVVRDRADCPHCNPERHWDLGADPSLRCSAGLHERCDNKRCTCRHHYWLDSGLRPVT